MANLFLAVLVLAAYVYTIAIGAPDETLKTLLIAIGGVFFGQVVPVNLNNITKKKQSGSTNNQKGE